MPETLSEGLSRTGFVTPVFLFESFPSKRRKEIFELLPQCLAFCELIFREEKLNIDEVAAAVAHFVARAEEPGECGKHGEVMNFLCCLRCSKLELLKRYR